MKLLRYLWALPNTLLGLLFVPLAISTKGGIRVVSGVLELHSGLISFILRYCLPVRGEVGAITLGHVVLGQNRESLSSNRRHERAHVRQYEVLGPAFIFVYLIAALWALIRGNDVYKGNYLERKAIEQEKGKEHSHKVGKTFLFIMMFALMLNYMTVGRVAANPSEPSLSAIVFFGIPSVKELKKNNNIKTANECLQKYLKSIPPKSYLWSADFPSNPEKTVNYKQRNLEEQIVVIMGEKTRNEAKAFSLAVPLYTEWEGMSENPLNESSFVDNWLLKRPGTSIKPFLYLFKAHRLRAGYECAKAGHEKGLWPILAKEYKKTLEKALSFNNPLISCIIKDMEAQPYVYLEGYGRP